MVTIVSNKSPLFINTVKEVTFINKQKISKKASRNKEKQRRQASLKETPTSPFFQS